MPGRPMSEIGMSSGSEVADGSDPSPPHFHLLNLYKTNKPVPPINNSAGPSEGTSRRSLSD